ncbi:MAG: methylenetetrahydrofolate reductase [Halobacteriales archaeon]
MSLGANEAVDEGVRELLDAPRYELMPFDSFGEQMGYLPDGSEITVTVSPTKGQDATIEWAEKAAEAGHDVVPHVAARYLESEDHLDEIAARMAEMGVEDIFVIAGDPEDPEGPYEGAYDALVALEELGYEFEEVGISGYPEGHQFLSEETLQEAMDRKSPHATYITTQLCYDPEDIVVWTEEIRERGADLPIEVGIPGVLKYQRLLNISQRVGVGDSLQFLQKTSGIFSFLRTLIGSRGKYTPDDLIDGLAPHVGDPEYDYRGVHIYTFNEVPDTEDWRKKRLQG